MNDKNDKIRYIHLRNNDFAILDVGLERPDSNGGATIAYAITPEGKDNVIVEIGVAWCSQRDTFNRRIGRDVAAGRLRKGGEHRKVVILPKPDENAGAGTSWRMLEARIIRAVVG